MSDNNVFNSIEISRDANRLQIINYLRKNLELEGVDLTKSSFLSFLIDVISNLTSNLLFYQLSTYKEFFLTKASLPESILNLSAFLGYARKEATVAKANLLMTIPLTFGSGIWTVTIDKNTVFYAKKMPFSNADKVIVKIEDNSNVTVQTFVDTQPSDTLPVSYSADGSSFMFLLPVEQYVVKTEEFVATDVKPFQFTYFDVLSSNQLSQIEVSIHPLATNEYIKCSPFSSLYMMSSTDYGFVCKKIAGGIRVFFGNGILGEQLETGTTVYITARETLGSEGNVIPGSINKGARLSAVDEFGKAKILNYKVTNPSSATGGRDEESLEEVRNNSISNVRSLNRLVSRSDYNDLSVIVKDLPTGFDSIPILKKSDLSGNNICEYLMLKFNNEFVPTRGISLTVPYHTPVICRDYVSNVHGINYVTLFDMYFDIDNESVSYKYVINEVTRVPTILSRYNSNYKIKIDKVVFKRVPNNSLEIRAHYLTEETDIENILCTLNIMEMEYSHDMTNDILNNEFVVLISPLTIVPTSNLTFNFELSHKNLGAIKKYSTSVVIRKNLDTYMTSDTYSDSTSGVSIIYDVPVVQQDYYESIDKGLFELEILQKLVSFGVLSNYRMITDFINLKFCNTYGKCTNMNYNNVSIPDVIDIDFCDIPESLHIGDKYIVGNEDYYMWSGHLNQIAECISTDPVTWSFYDARLNTIVYVLNKQQKYIFSQSSWVTVGFNLPLKVTIEVFVDKNLTKSVGEVRSEVKSALINHFKNKFGPSIKLYRSEIIDVVQSLENIRYSRLIDPKSDIFFDYNIDNFTENELLEYVPEYVYFTKDSIEVKVYIDETT